MFKILYCIHSKFLSHFKILDVKLFWQFSYKFHGKHLSFLTDEKENIDILY